MPKIEISISFVAFIAAIFCIDGENMLLPSMACALLHELGHIGAIYLCGGGIDRIRFSAFGAYIRLKQSPMLSYKKELFAAAAGPAVSIFAAWLFSVLGNRYGDDTLLFIAGANLLFALINLLPAYPLDGGRVLRCGALICTESAAAADVICAVSGGLCAVGTAALCGYINYRLSFQLSLTLFCAFLVMSFIKNMWMK